MTARTKRRRNKLGNPRPRDDAALSTAARLILFEQARLNRFARRLRQAKMLEGVAGQRPSPRRALNEALLDQIGLDDFFDRVARLRKRSGDGLDADRAARKAKRDRLQITAIHLVEAAAIDVEQPQRAVCDLAVDDLGLLDEREVAYAPQ